jgi:hypothetical protein
MLAASLLLGGCGEAPVLLELDVKTGPEHTLVMVRGKHLFLASVIWDAGLPTEREIPGSFLGPYMFSVPPGATVGNHPVAVKRGDKRSGKINFDVRPRRLYGPPRIDAVTIASASFTGGNLSPVLYVQGANIDVGAVVQINGTDVATVAHKGMRNDLYGIRPDELKYPIYHYVALLVLAGNRPAGSPITLTVRNLDGRISECGPPVVGQPKDPCHFVLPADAASLDSDGDDIPDAWEIAGYSSNADGVIDVDLPALGANPYRRDIFLEVDIMVDSDDPADPPTFPPIATIGDNPGTFDTVRAMFAAAPILNPYGESGINLVIDSAGTVPFRKFLGFSTTAATERFKALKVDHFANAKRGRIYHYAIWGVAHPDGASGHSDIVFDDTGVLGPGDDIVITLAGFGAEYQTVRSQAATLAHELGHNLGQRHGGNDSFWHKPNYLSVMSYAWQLRTSHSVDWRQKKLTCFPIYYGSPGENEINGAVPTVGKVTIDYSHGMAPPLDENALDEKKGVCGQALDWNIDGDKTGAGMSVDANRNGTFGEKYTDFANWRALDFRGPRLNGSVRLTGE